MTERRSRHEAPRPSPLDELFGRTGPTAHLRTSDGALSAVKVARFYGLSLKALAELLGKKSQAVRAAPDADSLQLPLDFFERIARLRAVLRDDASFRGWLRLPNPQLGGERPLAWICAGRWQDMADLVDDILAGSPS
jgi:hypothetical protein